VIFEVSYRLVDRLELVDGGSWRVVGKGRVSPMEKASACARIEKKDTAVLRRLYSLFVSRLAHKMPTFVQSVGSSLVCENLLRGYQRKPIHQCSRLEGQRSVNGQRTNRGIHVMYLLTASTPSLKLSRESFAWPHGPRGVGGVWQLCDSDLTQLEGRGAGAKSVTLNDPQRIERKHGHMITDC
jgi:hypothetical protein